MNYTRIGPGNLFPLEMHGNQPAREEPRNQVWLYPMPIGNQEPDTSLLNISITWIGPLEGVSWQSLADAFHLFARSRYADCIVPANVAVEVGLNALVASFLRKWCGKGRVRGFLEDAATYGHQLNMLLPVISGVLGQPQLPDQIRGELNRLRATRNAVAHRGEPEEHIDHKTAARLLTGSLFGFRYVDRLASVVEPTVEP